MVKIGFQTFSDDNHELEPGSWFENLGRFASRLLTEGVFLARRPKIIVLQVPTRSLAAAALNIGLSAQVEFSISAQESKLESSHLGSVAPGQMIQVRYEWQKNERQSPEKLTRVVVTGEFVSLTPQRAGTRFPVLTLNIAGAKTSISLTNNVTGVFVVDSKVPAGKQIQDGPITGNEIERWGGFFSQQAPTCCTFTYLSEFKSEIELEIVNHSLLDNYLRVPKLKVMELARLDRLTEDEQVHFVNAYETLRKFQKSENEVAALSLPFQFVILDGNAAVANLVGNSLLREKTKICILDSSNHERLSDAIAAIGQEVMHLTKNDKLGDLEIVDRDLGLRAEVWV
jgi:hypothetical protein